MRPSFLILAAALAAASTAMAAEGRFIHPADTNKDDRLSKAEWAAYKLPAADFAKADKNADGLIDGHEFGAWHLARQTAK
ncbi:hypothetical protein [Phenylobacterium sp.]|uniref:hypothetical protein n=1 Tax=Phenylobacterium sp. TaxID=1871053 RepID=UPI00286E43ED|nr:hypothetical protein [Phenylobacterium sp.]